MTMSEDEGEVIMSKEFAFHIGDVVANILHVDEVRRFSEYTNESMRPLSMRVEERISVECVGDIQLFYGCRLWDGNVQKHAEGCLVKADTLWDAWLEGLKKQESKKAKS